MKEFYTMSDVGSVLVGNKEFGVCFHNGYGDGTTSVVLCEKWQAPKDATFIDTIEGIFNIYNYDCSERDEEDIVVSLNGRYGVYCKAGTVYFEKW